METLTKTSDDLRAEHRRCVRDISRSFAQLEDALRTEKNFRAELHRNDSTFASTIPALKFNMFIQLCKKESCKEYDFITKWRQDVIARGLLVEGE